MYSRLTKTVKEAGRECVVCVGYGTDMCRIHKGDKIVDCAHCPMFGAILNQLHTFEEILFEEHNEQCQSGAEM